jgi:hypothetical protein
MAGPLMPTISANRITSFPVNDIIKTTCNFENHRADCSHAHVVVLSFSVLLYENVFSTE